MKLKSLIAAGALGLSLAAIPQIALAEAVFNAPVATRQADESGLQTAIFAGGCFWGIEAIFSHTRGVTSAVSGYHGGSADTATYRQIGSGRTGHAEAVRVTYDPSVVRYDQLLQILFSVGADPTLHNRQGPDVGPQYRSAIVPLTGEQRAVAQAYLRQMGRSGVWDRPIAVAIENYREFYEAEEYHQDYLLNHPDSAYIRRWDAPKVTALRSMFPTSGVRATGPVEIAARPSCPYVGTMATHHHHHEHSGDKLIEEAAKVLTDAGEQWTAMREDVFRALAAQDRPASAYDIAEQVGNERGKRVAANSVYRILDLFVRTNLANRIESANAYLANSHPGCQHDCIFLICDDCGQADHFDDDKLTGALRDAGKAHGYSNVRPVVELRGLCSDCAS